MRRFSCQLEKEVGIKAKHIAGGCKGIYCIQAINRGEGTLKHEYHQECKKCYRFIHYRYYRISATILCMIFFLLNVLICCTPQGAIRRRLFIRDGIDIAFTSVIEKTDSNGEKESYLVYIECGKERWNVECPHLVCFAFQDNY